MRIPFLILIISVIILQISCIKDTTPNQPSYQYDNMLLFVMVGVIKHLMYFQQQPQIHFRSLSII